MQLIDEPKTHIFSLNDTWLHVIEKWESFYMNSSPLLEGIEIIVNGKVTKDMIYEELMKENEELDELTGMSEDFMLFMCNPFEETAKRSASWWYILQTRSPCGAGNSSCSKRKYHH